MLRAVSVWSSNSISIIVAVREVASNKQKYILPQRRRAKEDITERVTNNVTLDVGFSLFSAKLSVENVSNRRMRGFLHAHDKHGHGTQIGNYYAPSFSCSARCSNFSFVDQSPADGVLM